MKKLFETLFFYGLATVAHGLSVVRLTPPQPVDTPSVWGVNKYKHIYKRPIDGTGGWKRIPGLLTHVSASGEGWIWGVNHHEDIYKCQKPCDTGNWVKMDGKAVRVSGGKTHVYVVNSADEIYCRPVDGSGGWEKLPGRLTDISASGGDVVYGANKVDLLYTCDGSNCDGDWRGQDQWNANARAVQVNAVPLGNEFQYWAVNSNDEIWRKRGDHGAWSKMPGGLIGVAPSNYDYIWGVNSADEVWMAHYTNWHASGLSWKNIGGKLVQISVEQIYNPQVPPVVSDNIYCDSQLKCPSNKPVCNFDNGDSGFCEECTSDCYGTGYINSKAIGICCDVCPISRQTCDYHRKINCNSKHQCPSHKPVCNFDNGNSGFCEECPGDCYGTGYINSVAIGICCERCPTSRKTCDLHRKINCDSKHDCPSHKPVCNFDNGNSGFCEECPGDCYGTAVTTYSNAKATENCCDVCPTSRGSCDLHRKINCDSKHDCPSHKPVCNFDYGASGFCQECPGDCYSANFINPNAIGTCCDVCPTSRKTCDLRRTINCDSKHDCPSHKPVCNFDNGNSGFCEECPGDCYGTGYINSVAIGICCDVCPTSRQTCDLHRNINCHSYHDCPSHKPNCNFGVCEEYLIMAADQGQDMVWPDHTVEYHPYGPDYTEDPDYTQDHWPDYDQPQDNWPDYDHPQDDWSNYDQPQDDWSNYDQPQDLWPDDCFNCYTFS